MDHFCYHNHKCTSINAISGVTSGEQKVYGENEQLCTDIRNALKKKEKK